MSALTVGLSWSICRYTISTQCVVIELLPLLSRSVALCEEESLSVEAYEWGTELLK